MATGTADEPVAGGSTGSFSVSTDVVTSQVNDELLLIDFGADRFLSLDPVGARMWEVLAATGSTDAVVEAILAEYDVEEGELRVDVDAFVAHLCELGVVHRR